MPALTIKNIPETLYQALKSTAKAHRRSINNEVIILLEEKLLLHTEAGVDWTNKVETIRAKIPVDAISEDDIENAIISGRP